MSVFHTAYKIGMTGTGPGYLTLYFIGFFKRLDSHDLCPMGPVLVFYYQPYGRAERMPMTDTSDDLSLVFFNLHPPATAMTFLTARKIFIYIFSQ